MQLPCMNVNKKNKIRAKRVERMSGLRGRVCGGLKLVLRCEPRKSGSVVFVES